MNRRRLCGLNDYFIWIQLFLFYFHFNAHSLFVSDLRSESTESVFSLFQRGLPIVCFWSIFHLDSNTNIVVEQKAFPISITNEGRTKHHTHFDWFISISIQRIVFRIGFYCFIVILFVNISNYGIKHKKQLLSIQQ